MSVLQRVIPAGSFVQHQAAAAASKPSSSRLLHSSARSLVKAAPSKAHHHSTISDSAFPHGYIVTGLHSGVKPSTKTNNLDLAVIASSTPRTSSAACFTRNVFKAAPVQVSTAVLRNTGGRANRLVVNSGCANAVTGTKGLDDAWSMARATDAILSDTTATKSGEEKTLVMSTGVIGQLLPIEKILAGISSARANLASSTSSNFSSWELAARAFMTTDTFPKLRARSFELEGKTVRFAGIDKGAGMIHPNMGPPHATLLGLIATDAAVSPRSLQTALTYAVERSFNSISVDGDMSTNDTIVAFANGAAFASDAVEIDEETNPAAYAIFRDELTDFATDLAKLVVRDGEGATKFVTVRVEGTATYEDAHKIASTVSTSSLVKCALYGEDANWGRILCAVGYAPVSQETTIDPFAVSVSFIPADGTWPFHLLINGEPEKIDEARASEIISQEDLEILITLGGDGQGKATYYTCDLSHEYVTINGDYRS